MLSWREQGPESRGQGVTLCPPGLRPGSLGVQSLGGVVIPRDVLVFPGAYMG